METREHFNIAVAEEQSGAQLRSPTKAAKSKGQLNVNAREQFRISVAEKRKHTRSRSSAKAITRSSTKSEAAPRDQLIKDISDQIIQLDEEYSDSDREDSAMLTPRAGRSPDRRGRAGTASSPQPRLTSIPILSNHSSESDYVDTASSTASGTSSKRDKRDRSPTKTLADLKLLNKPVEYISDEDTVQGKVPEDVRKLWTDIRRLCKGNGYIPRTLCEHFGGVEDEYEDELVSDSRSADGLHFELKQMIAVKTQAHKIEGDSETQWYCSVHWPILTAAFCDQPFIEPKVVTHARPIKDFLPKVGKQYTESKLVDLTVNLIPPSSVNIIQWLATQPPKYRTVNQSLSGPLIQNPTVISIEVKTSQGPEVAAMVQVGIWISAWHERVQRLHKTRQFIVTLPVIITSVHEWRLYFAVDRGDSIVNIHLHAIFRLIHSLTLCQEMLRFPGEIGGTLSLNKMYRLLAVLRRLGKYAKDVYEPWFLEKFFHPSGVPG